MEPYRRLEELVVERFFSLTAAERDRLWPVWRVLYGDGSSAHARSEYDDWQSGRRRMSPHTARRVCEAVPSILPHAERLALIQASRPRPAASPEPIRFEFVGALDSWAADVRPKFGLFASSGLAPGFDTLPWVEDTLRREMAASGRPWETRIQDFDADAALVREALQRPAPTPEFLIRIRMPMGNEVRASVPARSIRPDRARVGVGAVWVAAVLVLIAIGGLSAFSARDRLADGAALLGHAAATRPPASATVPVAAPTSALRTSAGIAAPTLARPPTASFSANPTATPERVFIPYAGNGGGPTQCRDGTWSHSSGRGTCSHHGGVR